VAGQRGAGGPRARPAGADAPHAAGHGPARPHRLPQAAGPPLRRPGDRADGGPGSGAVPADPGRGGGQGGRRPGARRGRAVARPDHRRHHGPADRGRAPDPALGRGHGGRPGRGIGGRRPRRRLDRDGDVRHRARRVPPRVRGRPRRHHGPAAAHQVRGRRAHERRRLRLLLRPAGHRGQRHHQGDDERGRARADAPPRPAGGPAGRPCADPRRGGGDAALLQPAALLPAHRHRRHRGGRAADPGRRQGGAGLYVGQPRRDRVRPPPGLRHPAYKQLPVRLVA
jgi:hypothetical protein